MLPAINQSASAPSSTVTIAFRRIVGADLLILFQSEQGHAAALFCTSVLLTTRPSWDTLPDFSVPIFLPYQYLCILPLSAPFRYVSGHVNKNCILLRVPLFLNKFCRSILPAPLDLAPSEFCQSRTVFVTGPISSPFLLKQISCHGLRPFPTGEMTAAKAHTGRIPQTLSNSAKGTSRSSTSSSQIVLRHAHQRPPGDGRKRRVSTSVTTLDPWSRRGSWHRRFSTFVLVAASRYMFAIPPGAPS